MEADAPLDVDVRRPPDAPGYREVGGPHGGFLSPQPELSPQAVPMPMPMPMPMPVPVPMPDDPPRPERASGR